MARSSQSDVQFQAIGTTGSGAGPSPARSTPPRTPYEEVVFGIWSDVLRDVRGGAGFGVHDDFFQLGGHSLLAPKIVARVRKTFGVQIAVRNFFECRTVAGLASVVAAQLAQGSAPIERRPAGAEPVLSFDQQRLWLENQLLPSLAYNMQGRQRLVGALDVAAFAASVRAILERHESLRTRFPVVDGRPVQLVDELADDWRLDVRDVSGSDDPEQQAARIAGDEATTPFDLAAGNLLRIVLIKTGDREHVLSLTAHHIVCDDWSVGLFFRELAALYQAGGDPERAGLEPLPIQYRDFAGWQRERLVGETLERTVGYWRDHLAGAPPVLTMPVARHRGGDREHGQWARGGLSEDETAALRVLCRTQGVSPFMVLLATLATVLARWSGQRDVVIGVPTAGRTEPGTDALIGFLVNTLPIRVDLAGDPTFAELLARVRQVCLDGYAHSDAPLDVLVQQVELTRDTRHTPLFQVVLSMLNTAHATAQLPGITVEAMDAATELPTKLDLTVNVQETAGRMHFQLDYNPERYDPAMVRVLVSHLERLLRAAIADPTRGIFDYSLASPVVPPAESVSAERAAPPAERVAVVAADGEHTYGWLARAVAREIPRGEHLGLVRRPTAAFVAALQACISSGTDYTVIEADNNDPLWTLGITSLLDVDAEVDAGDGPAVRAQGWAVGPYDLAGSDRFAALTSRPGLLAAAVSNAFAAGGTLVLVPADATDLGGWLRDNAITVAFLGPPQLRALTEPLPALRFAFVDNAGDLIGHDLDALRRLAPQCRIIAVYRPGRDGRPVATYEATDEAVRLRVPLGVELPGHRSGHDTVGEVAELDRTGDLARRWSDGTLDYVAPVGASLTRDPLETLAALRDLPDVTDAVVVDHPGPDGEAVLTAYVTGPARHSAEIRQDLVLQLPDYLTPEQLFVLDRLPRTAYGDYDLEALPAATGGAPAGATPPRTPYEEVVHGIWGDVLGVSGFGVHDDFFELGGHSLLAPRIATRIYETLGVQIPVADFFGARTVAALASVVAAQSTAGRQVIERRPAQAESVLSFDQQRLWLENQLVPSLAYNVHGRQRFTGVLDVAALEASVRAILERHESLRTRFPVVDGRPVQVVDDLPEGWRLDVRDVSGSEDPVAQAARIADEEATTPFGLAAGSLFRCVLVKTGDTGHLLSLTAHHIVCDDWSVGLFVRELSALYQAGGDPQRAGLDPLPIQYRDYAAWQRERLVGDTLERTVAYWRDHLAGAPPALTLPAIEAGAATREAGDRARSYLSEDETAALQGFCRTHGVSPFMVLMAALATVLARWSGQRDLVIGVPTAGRTDAGTDALIGFLLNTLPIRVDLAGEPTFAELLARVRQVCLDGYAHSDAPLDVLVQQLELSRDPRRTPLFQVVLNVVGSSPVVRLPGITVEPMDSATALPTKFDLSLNVQESGQRTYFQLDYNPQRYDPAMMRALVSQLEALLRAAVDDPALAVFDFPLGPAPAVPVETVAVEPAGQLTLVTPDGERQAVGAMVSRIPGGEHVGLIRRPTAAFIAALLGCLATGTDYTVVDPDLTVPLSYLGITAVLDVAESAADVTDLREIGLLGWAAGRYRLTSDDRIAALTHRPGHLVAAVTNAVAAGAALYLPPAETTTWLRDNAITVAFLSPPQLRALTEPLPALRLAFVDNAGDLLSHDLDALRKLAPQCRIVSVYRPGRDGRPLASYEATDDTPLRVPLGRELAGDAAGAAVGEVVELRFDGRPTGDLGRRWSDGTLEYVGRAGANPAHDPGQTLAALRELPEVTDAVVTEYADPEGEPALVGYLSGPGPDADPAALRQHLVPRLPDFLIPIHLFVVDGLPRTPDGDYDLAALPQPDEEDLEGDAYVAPRTPLEHRLTEIFEELLGLEQIGVYDSFFELNGFSLLATQMTSRVRETFNVELPLREVFGAPTVQGLAQLILWKQSEQSDAAQLEAMLAEIEAER